MNMIIDNLQFVDLGLPSGKLWATENVKNENGDEAYYTFDDAVNTFGENLPSKEDWKELLENSTYKWNKKKMGYNVTGPNGNSIFLPAAGFRCGVSVWNVGSHGYYWSSSDINGDFAHNVRFHSGSLGPNGSNYRYNGLSVRLCKNK